MGLGKTLQSLMLILANPAPSDWVDKPEEHEAAGHSLCPIKTTLIVVPANLLDQWQQQVEEHTVEGALKVGWRCCTCGVMPCCAVTCCTGSAAAQQGSNVVSDGFCRWAREI
jgi:hypothetical protein